MERMETDRIAKSAYIGECAGNRSVDRMRKRSTDTVKDCLRKRFGCQETRRMLQDRSEWRGFVRGNA